jgi:hypothetical protein
MDMMEEDGEDIRQETVRNPRDSDKPSDIFTGAASKSLIALLLVFLIIAFIFTII